MTNIYRHLIYIPFHTIGGILWIANYHNSEYKTHWLLLLVAICFSSATYSFIEVFKHFFKRNYMSLYEIQPIRKKHEM